MKPWPEGAGQGTRWGRDPGRAAEKEAAEQAAEGEGEALVGPGAAAGFDAGAPGAVAPAESAAVADRLGRPGQSLYR